MKQTYSRISIARTPMALYHGYFEHVVGSLTRNTIVADITVHEIVRVIFFLY